MDTDQLITEAEAFSPPKTSTVYKDIPNVDVDEFKKIPHGLSHKHSSRHSPSRRNSMSAIRAPLSTLNSSSPSSKQHLVTFTCPRSNTYSGKQLVGLNKLKANLDSKLKNATFSEDTEEENNKENSFATPSKGHTSQQLHSSLLHTPSISSKRRSSETVTDSSKRLKSDDSILKTPLRPTEPVAASPSNEQNSRIIDNSHLLLDTRKSPNPSSALTSPLANVSHMNSSHINQSADGIEDIDAQTMLAEDSLREEDEEEEGTSAVAVNSSFSHHLNEKETHNGANSSPNKLKIVPLDFDEFAFKDVEDESDFEPTILSSPMSKPTFTVRQMDEIQKDHSTEISRLESLIHEKSESLSDLTKSLNVAQQETHSLKDKLTSFQVENNKLTDLNKMLNMRITSVEQISLKLSKQLKQKDNRIGQLYDQAVKFKENFNQVVQEKDNIISSLQENLKSEKSNTNELSTQIGTLSNTITNLKVDLKEKSSDIEKLINEHNILKDEAAKQNEKINYLNSQQIESEKEKTFLNDQLDSKLAEIKDLTEFKIDLENAIQVCNEKLLEWEEKNVSLVDDLESLSQDFKLKKLESDEQQQEINDLHASLESKMKELDILFDEKEEMAQDLKRLRNELEEEKQVMSQVYKDLENEKQSLNIKTTEYNDLNESHEELKSKYGSLNRELVASHEQYTKLELDLETANEKISHLQNLLEKSNKNETQVVQELNVKLSKLQDTLISKENELNSVHTEKDDLLEKCSAFDQLTEEVQILKQKLTEEQASSEQKLQQLAQDLYVQYSKKREQKVSILKKGYETKWSNKFRDLEAENLNLLREVDSLKKQLSNERDEKNQLVKLWDQLVEMEGPNKKLI